MLKATVNSQTFDIQSDKNDISVNSQPFSWDLVEIKDGNFHMIYNHKSYNAEVLEADYQAKSFLIKINNTKYSVVVKDRFDTLLD